MVNLVALVLILASSATPQRPVRVNEPPRAAQVQNAPAARQLTQEQKAWFAHAIDDILTGE